MSNRKLLPLFAPPLLNSSSRWATTAEELDMLYRCPQTGATSVRTSLLHGFDHRDNIHQHCFFDPATMQSRTEVDRDTRPQHSTTAVSSLNTLGYSPISLPSYIDIIKGISLTAPESPRPGKPVIFSVTGSAYDVAECLQLLTASRPPDARWLMEVNLSCPNIPGEPPPAYSRSDLASMLYVLCKAQSASVLVGLKLPPFTYQDQFVSVIGALLDSQGGGHPCPVSFLTCTNTLGSCFVTDDSGAPAIASADGSGIGGLAGPALHALSLGNVRKFRSMLDAEPSLRDISIIGVGGVHDHASYKRMLAAGADAVGVATALGIEGADVFAKILNQDPAA